MVTYADRPWTKNYDPGIPLSLEPYPTIPLHEFLRQSAKNKPKATALITSARIPGLGRFSHQISYEELNRLSDQMAVALIQLGLKKGDRVVLVMPNVAAFPIAFYAVLKAGGVVAATNPTYPPPRMQYQVNDTGAKIVITLSLFYNLIKEIQPKTEVKHVISASVKDYLPTLPKILFSLFREKKDGHAITLQKNDFNMRDLLKQTEGQTPPAIEVTQDDVALFQYTGGTTGTSKGAMLTHGNMVINTHQLWNAWQKLDDPKFKGMNPEDAVFLGVLPLFHAAGLEAVMGQAVASGSPMVLVPNPRDINEVIDVIHTFKPTGFVGVPALYNAINNHPRVKSGEVSLASMVVSSSGTAPLSPATKRAYEELSGNVITEGYGMSESGVTHANPFINPTKINSVGLPFPDIDVRIVNVEDGVSDMPIGEVGEILMSGPTIMKGYHNMPTETANSLRQHADGRMWLHTGDIGYMDEDGYFYIVDRKKDMAIIGGFNVYPNVVEKTIMEHPAVLEVGVAGIEHPEKVGQETIKAWIVLKPNMQVTDKELVAHCEKFLAPYEVPRRFAFVNEIPKSAVGKVLRRELILLEQSEREKR